MKRRQCSRAGCSGMAVATLTFAYADSMAVLGPLALRGDPGTYDLCDTHSGRLSVPRGWEVVRLPLDVVEQTSHDDLVALANAVREAAAYEPETTPAAAREPLLPPTVVEVGRRGHLTLLADAGPLV